MESVSFKFFQSCLYPGILSEGPYANRKGTMCGFNTCVKHAVAFCVKYYECFKVCVVRNDIVIFTWNTLSAM